MDEHRLGLRPVLRRVWARRGQRPVARGSHRSAWRSGSCCVRPATGQSCWLILPTVNAQVFALALAQFAKEVGAGAQKRSLLVLDQAGYHTAQEVAVPAGIEREFLPPHRPELQPAERRWPLTNEGVANTVFTDLDELEEVLIKRCVELADQPAFIRSHTLYHWWPRAA